MVIVGASFSFQERIYTPACLPVVAWQGPVLGGGPPDLGQLEGCASSGQFSSRQSLTAQPTNSPEHNQEASCGTHMYHTNLFIIFTPRNFKELMAMSTPSNRS